MQAYFRDVTHEDLQVLLPGFDDPLQDPAYLVPPIGPHFSADDIILSPRATRGVKAVGLGHPNKRIPVRCVSDSIRHASVICIHI